MLKNKIILSNTMIMLALLAAYYMRIIDFQFLIICLFLLMTLLRAYTRDIAILRSEIVKLPMGQDRMKKLNKIKAIKEIMHIKQCDRENGKIYFLKLQEQNWITKNNEIKWKKMYRTIFENLNVLKRKEKAYRFFIYD